MQFLHGVDLWVNIERPTDYITLSFLGALVVAKNKKRVKIDLIKAVPGRLMQ